MGKAKWFGHQLASLRVSMADGAIATASSVPGSNAWTWVAYPEEWALGPVATGSEPTLGEAKAAAEAAIRAHARRLLELVGEEP